MFPWCLPRLYVEHTTVKVFPIYFRTCPTKYEPSCTWTVLGGWKKIKLGYEIVDAIFSNIYIFPYILQKNENIYMIWPLYIFCLLLKDSQVHISKHYWEIICNNWIKLNEIIPQFLKIMYDAAKAKTRQGHRIWCSIIICYSIYWFPSLEVGSPHEPFFHFMHSMSFCFRLWFI